MWEEREAKLTDSNVSSRGWVDSRESALKGR